MNVGAQRTWSLHAHELLQREVCRSPGISQAYSWSPLVQLWRPSSKGTQPADAGHTAAARGRQLQVPREGGGRTGEASRLRHQVGASSGAQTSQHLSVQIGLGRGVSTVCTTECFAKRVLARRNLSCFVISSQHATQLS